MTFKDFLMLTSGFRLSAGMSLAVSEQIILAACGCQENKYCLEETRITLASRPLLTRRASAAPEACASALARAWAGSAVTAGVPAGVNPAPTTPPSMSYSPALLIILKEVNSVLSEILPSMVVAPQHLRVTVLRHRLHLP